MTMAFFLGDLLPCDYLDTTNIPMTSKALSLYIPGVLYINFEVSFKV